MSQLFFVKENTITYHIKEIYKTEELEKEGTARENRVVRKEGNRSVNRVLDFCYWHELRNHQKYSNKIGMKTGTLTQVPVPMTR